MGMWGPRRDRNANRIIWRFAKINKSIIVSTPNPRIITPVVPYSPSDMLVIFRLRDGGGDDGVSDSFSLYVCICINNYVLFLLLLFFYYCYYYLGVSFVWQKFKQLSNNMSMVISFANIWNLTKIIRIKIHLLPELNCYQQYYW